MMHVTSLYFNSSARYSLDASKTKYYYPDLIDFQYAPLTYPLCFEPTFIIFCLN